MVPSDLRFGHAHRVMLDVDLLEAARQPFQRLSQHCLVVRVHVTSRHIIEWVASLVWFAPNLLRLKPPILLPVEIDGPALGESRETAFQEVGAAGLDDRECHCQEILRVIVSILPSPCERRQHWGRGSCKRLEG